MQNLTLHQTKDAGANLAISPRKEVLSG